jgi:hypothetical protein
VTPDEHAAINAGAPHTTANAARRVIPDLSIDPDPDPAGNLPTPTGEFVSGNKGKIPTASPSLPRMPDSRQLAEIP